jgi:hypothetical protein
MNEVSRSKMREPWGSSLISGANAAQSR